MSDDTTAVDSLNYTFEEVRAEAERVYGPGCEISFEEKSGTVHFGVRGRLGNVSITHQNVNYVLCAAHSALSTLPTGSNL